MHLKTSQVNEDQLKKKIKKKKKNKLFPNDKISYTIITYEKKLVYCS